ncbi:hypothetical protein PS918_05775 [Pseudomonas fluorescens]|uniref:RHS repeat-associated core domain-containing protein n=1 Tax=Pseudomonas fluorescens TaxID=294 RepID=A0A5E7UUV4_PSEFL|nr:RHS repeat-associated core domain-containing protein [Pseudomonas fluorescens]VVQ14803.1 hypothetical protein PS918_05775 [Pseudomonas fluorescens]
MPRQNMKSLCSYRYDPLDRLVACATSAQASTQRFYLKDRLVTEVQGTVKRSILQHEDQLLAQQQRQNGTLETGMFATDQQRSVLNVRDMNRPNPLAYTPYGHRVLGNGLLSLLGFNGERPDPVTGWYLLGNGFRAYSPVLMRFICPDSANFSPFGKGGLNAYAYCVGDPVNRSDPTGHFGKWFRRFANRLTRRQSRIRVNPSKGVADKTPVKVVPPEGPQVAATQRPQLPGNAVARLNENIPQQPPPSTPPVPRGNSTPTSTTPNRAPVTVQTLIDVRRFELRRYRLTLEHNPDMPYDLRNKHEVYHDNMMNTLNQQLLDL